MEISKFERKQAVKNTVKITESAVRRYDKKIKLTNLSHERERSSALGAFFFLKIRDIRKETDPFALKMP